MAEDRISAEEAERLREMLLKYDRDRPPNVFDLSKPPVKPYTHQAFPKVLYDHEKSAPASVVQKKDLLNNVYSEQAPAKIVTKNVNSEEELEAALAEGWQEKPPTFDDAEVSAMVSDAPRRPGRPRKQLAEA